MNFLTELLETFSLMEDVRTQRQMEEVIRIINSHATNENSFQDILVRIMAFTNGLSRPDTDKDESIDVIPVLDDLIANGFVKRVGNGRYRRTDPLSKLMSLQVRNQMDDVIGHSYSSNGKLSLEQTKALRNFLSTPGDTLGDKLNASPEIWKSGGKHSGDVKNVVKQTIIEKDPSYQKLNPSTKNMLHQLQSLSKPYDSFHVLKYLMKLQQTKKGYGKFIEEVHNAFKSEKYLDALQGLEEIGVVNGNRLNYNAIDEIRNVVQWMKEPAIENISQNDKLAAFLPNFHASSTATSAVVHRGINGILSNKSLTDVIIPRMTQKTFDLINDNDLQDLKNEAKASGKNTKYYIKLLSDTLNIVDVDAFKTKVYELKTNRENYKGDENREAKRTGRFEEFLKNFSI